jgi:hypothetical protein
MKYKDLIPILDKEVSLYVRLSAADSRGIVRCVTCGSYHHWEDITLGHYISRGKHSVRWNLKNVAPQCRHCNSFLGGEQYKMRAYLVNQYGEKTVEAMEAWADMTKTETSETLRMKIAEYREKNKALKKQQRVLS